MYQARLQKVCWWLIRQVGKIGRTIDEVTGQKVSRITGELSEKKIQEIDSDEDKYGIKTCTKSFQVLTPLDPGLSMDPLSTPSLSWTLIFSGF